MNGPTPEEEKMRGVLMRGVLMNCLGRKQGLGRRLLVLSILAIGIVVLSPVANTTILPLGPCPAANPGDTVTPCLANGQGPGTLLASLSAPFTTTLGTTSGTLVSAVFKEAGGTLDFYYQVFVNTTATNCGTAGKPGCDPLSRETDTDFSTWLTQLAFRTDGSTLPGGLFVNGDTTPQTADRNVNPGDVIGFTFNGAPTPAPIQPGHTSNVLIISTNATLFTAGHAAVIDGSTVTVASFRPAPAAPCTLTITCPANITKFVDSGQNTATVNPGAPSTSDNCSSASVTGVRSDGKPLNAPYPIGVTLITWTATDTNSNTASCTQTVTVLVPSGGGYTPGPVGPRRRRP
jgi:hypothetical protein